MRKSGNKSTLRKMEPALSPEDRENQLISLAINRAEQQLIDGTASAQVITHYLKLASSKERLENEILELKKDLIAAQTESIKSAKHMEEQYKEAMDAMRRYSGYGDEDDRDDY